MKLALVFLTALPVFGQGMASMSSSFSMGPDGSLRGTATFHAMPFLPPAVINAPYSGEETSESVQVLADGTRITRPNPGPQQKIWRDSQGRVRTERPLVYRRDNHESPTIVQINDPLAGYLYVIDTVNHVAHRLRVEARPARPVATPAPPTSSGGGTGGAGGAPMPPLPWQSTTEQLGTKTIDGVLVIGTRTTTTIPEGAQGNDRPMTSTNEVWMSKELQLPILSIFQSPTSGTVTRKYLNFSTNEPAPSLFMVPPGYTIVDEKESFTIKWGEP